MDCREPDTQTAAFTTWLLAAFIMAGFAFFYLPPGIQVPDRARFAAGTPRFLPGEVLFGYTDGVTDALGEEGEMVGSARLLALFSGPWKNTGELVARAEQAVAVHAGAARAQDGETILALGHGRRD
jgi:hypothetical protein